MAINRTLKYREQIKELAHRHSQTIDQITAPSFFFFNPQWPDFVQECSEHYQHPCTKIVDDLHSYRNSFGYQKERQTYLRKLEREAA